jgi:hypothetical protein
MFTKTTCSHKAYMSCSRKRFINEECWYVEGSGGSLTWNSLCVSWFMAVCFFVSWFIGSRFQSFLLLRFLGFEFQSSKVSNLQGFKHLNVWMKNIDPIPPTCPFLVCWKMLIPFSRVSRKLKTNLHDLSVPVISNMFKHVISKTALLHTTITFRANDHCVVTS